MKNIIKILAVAMVAFLAIGFVSAYQGNPLTSGPAVDQERHTAMLNAFENMDYETWVSLMQGKGKVVEKITEENFEQFAKMHEAKINGDMETANQIREELGLGLGQGKSGMQKGNRQNKGMRQGLGQR